MKMLVQRTPTSANPPFALAKVKEYARIDGPNDDLALAGMGRDAAAEVEHFAQIALLSQLIRVTILDMEHGAGLTLPVGPVAQGGTATVTIDGQPFTGFDLVTGARPYISWPASIHGKASARVVIEYPAGFGDEAENIPDDLAQAVLDQVALIFDGRAPHEAKTLARSSHLARVGARYRGVSI